MGTNEFSRRTFLAATGATPAASAASREPVVAPTYPQVEAKAQQDPIQVVTMYRFEPHETRAIQAAVPGAKVEIVICSTRDEFRQKLKDAEVVYGDLRGADLDYAPKLKWVQAGGAGVEGMDEVMRKSPVVMTNYARTFAPGIS
ncbi:MAG: hypothetical protein NT090_09780, partial [Acidobacteria bacterium]|nr:hypothetical protein [Acidobacteriota bacterium]